MQFLKPSLSPKCIYNDDMLRAGKVIFESRAMRKQKEDICSTSVGKHHCMLTSFIAKQSAGVEQRSGPPVPTSEAVAGPPVPTSEGRSAGVERSIPLFSRLDCDTLVWFLSSC